MTADVGVGIDITDAEDVADAIRAHGRRYLERVYTPLELAECSIGGAPSPLRLSRRFAAKEATFKALGAGDRPVDWRWVEVRASTRGPASVRLAPGAARMASAAGLSQLSVSVTSVSDWSMAVVIAQVQSAAKNAEIQKMDEKIRRAIHDHARLPVDVNTLSEDADLYQAGMTSHASVSVMLALEDAFDIEFPDRMLKRSVFASVAAIRDALTEARTGGGVTVTAGRDQTLVASVRQIGAEVAAAHADEVDRQGRFPAETIDALRAARALSAPVPPALGGDGASLGTIAACCLELGRYCGSSAMVFAMHQIQVFSILRHYEPGSWFESYLGRLSAEQRLIASVTSEVGTGGDMSRSVAGLDEVGDGTVRYEKQAPTISYGAYADDLLTSLRRSAEAEPGDQVAALSVGDQHTLQPTGTWDVLGMRGTCSPGYIVKAALPAEQVLTASWAAVATQSMVPISHVLWSHLWLGIAEDAFDRARAFVRAAAKRTPGEVPTSAQRLSRLASELSMLRAEIDSGLVDLIAWGEDREQLSTMGAILRFNNLKIAASEHAADVCRGALEVTGIMGFKNDTPFSVGRHLRDTTSAALMVANERLHQTNARLLLIAKEV